MQSDGEFSHHSTTDDAESRFPGHWLSAGESKCRIYEINSIQAILFNEGASKSNKIVHCKHHIRHIHIYM